MQPVTVSFVATLVELVELNSVRHGWKMRLIGTLLILIGTVGVLVQDFQLMWIWVPLGLWYILGGPLLYMALRTPGRKQEWTYTFDDVGVTSRAGETTFSCTWEAIAGWKETSRMLILRPQHQANRGVAKRAFPHGTLELVKQRLREGGHRGSSG